MPDSRASVSVTIGAKLGSAFKNTFSVADKQLSKFGAEIKNVENKAGQIEAYRKNARALDQASIAYNNARQKLNVLKSELVSSGAPTKSFANDVRKAEREVEKAKKAFFAAGNSTRSMGQALRSTGIDTRSLNKETVELGKSLKTLRDRQASLQKTMNAQAANKAKRSEYRSQMFDAVALGGALYGMIKPAVDFEYAMAKVGAITNEAADSDGFKKLSEKARELGRTTQYTSAQAAEAMQYLGMAGFNTQQILAATPAALNLAIAGNMDLGRTADIASNILTGFNIKAEETARVADVLAQASRTTNVNVEMLGETMKYAAPVASAVGGTLEETAALAGVLGDAGIQATMSGTMLRAAYLRLAAPVGKGAKALDKMKNTLHLTAEEMPDVAKQAAVTQAHLTQMGVAVFDKSGKMRSMVDILKDMSVALKDASDQKKLETVKAIFGDRAAAGALNIFKSIENMRFDEVMDKINHSHGAAQEMADRMKATTKGAFLELKSAAESVAISFGTVLLPSMTEAMQQGAGWANQLSKLAETHPIVSKAIGYTAVGMIGLKIATIACGFAFTYIKGAWLAGSLALKLLGIDLSLVNKKMIMNKALAMASGFKTFGKTLLGLATGVFPLVVKGFNLIRTAILLNPIGLIITGLAVGAALLITYWKPARDFFNTIWDGFCNGLSEAWNAIKKFFEPLAKLKELAGKAWNFAFGADETAPGDLSPQASPIGKTITADIGHDINGLNSKAKAAIANDNSSKQTINNNIVVNGSPGMNEQQLAKEVDRMLSERERRIQSRKRAVNYD